MSDYIDREDVLDLTRSGQLIANCNYQKVCKLIEDIPSADVRPVKRGKWKSENEYTLLCSQCGAYLWNNVSVKWNYCPNCGADMRGENDV